MADHMYLDDDGIRATFTMEGERDEIVNEVAGKLLDALTSEVGQ